RESSSPQGTPHAVINSASARNQYGSVSTRVPSISHSTPRSCVITNRLLFHIRSGEAPWNIAGRTFNPWAVWPNHVSSRWPEGRQPATFTCRAPKPRVLQDTPQIRARQIYQFGSLPAQHGTQCIQGEAFDLLGGNGWWDGKLLAFGHHIQNGGAVMA